MCHDSARVPMTARAGVRPERERAVRKGLVLRPKQAKSSESRGHAHGSHTAGPGGPCALSKLNSSSSSEAWIRPNRRLGKKVRAAPVHLAGLPLAVVQTVPLGYR